MTVYTEDFVRCHNQSGFYSFMGWMSFQYDSGPSHEKDVFSDTEEMYGRKERNSLKSLIIITVVLKTSAL